MTSDRRLLLLLLRSQRLSAQLRPLVLWLLVAERLAAAQRSGGVPRSLGRSAGPDRGGAQRPRAHRTSLTGRRPRG